MIKLAVCDDDVADRTRLYHFIKESEEILKTEYEIKLFESGEQFLKSGFEPDILFLDIVMNEKDGIQVGDEVKRQRPNILIIYTTNICEKIVIAVNHIHAFGYIVKPIKKENLFCVLSDAVKQLNQNDKEEIVMFLSENKTIIELPVSEIYYFEYVDRKIRIVTKARTYICKEKINDIADRMEQYGFVMSHQSFVVNLYQVEKISEQSLIMKNSDKVCLAQKRAAIVRKQLIQIAKNSGEWRK